jgi:MFS transporter, CP family, cyanate transporter
MRQRAIGWKPRMFLLTPPQLWIFLAGVVAAAQLGKMPALMPAIRPDLGLGLILGAVVIALVELGGALFGSVAAGIAARLSRIRVLYASLAALGLGSLVQAAAGGPSGLIAGRVLEAAGYLGVIVTAPVLMARAARPGEAGRSLAIWSTFVAIGIAIGATLSGYVAESWSWRAALVIWGLAAFAMLGIGLNMSLPAPGPAEARVRMPGRLAVLAAVGFGFYACFQVGLLALAPQYLVSERHLGVQAAGGLTGLGALVTALGALAPLVLGRSLHAGTGMTGVLVGSLVVPGLLGFVFFSDLPVWLLAATFIALNLLLGVYSALAFARMPLMSQDGDVTGVTGAIAQCGATGSLLGPPAYGLCVTLAGWQAAAAFGFTAACTAFLLTRAANRRLLRRVSR